MTEPRQEKAFAIDKHVVAKAFKEAKANGGAAGIDGQSIPDFEKDVKDNLYKLWLCRAYDYAEWAAPELSCGWSNHLELSEDSA